MLLKHLKNKRERKETGRNKVIYPDSWNKNSWPFVSSAPTPGYVGGRCQPQIGRKLQFRDLFEEQHEALSFRITLRPADSHSLALCPEQPQQSHSCLPFCSSKVNIIAHFLMPKQCSSHQSFLSRDLSISPGTRRRPSSPASREMACTQRDFCICFSQ